MPQHDYYSDRISSIDRKLDLAADAAIERARRDVRDMRRADALDAEEAREKARKDRTRCLDHQTRYDAVFAKHGSRAPQPVADDAPPSYRRRLFAVGQSMLPTGHPLADFDPQDIDGAAIIPLEGQLLQALDREATEPTGDNIPGEGEPLREVTKIDSASGLKTTSFYGESFIKGLNRTGRKVRRLVDPRNGRVLLGQAWSTPPG
jgi:hypothetical protein